MPKRRILVTSALPYANGDIHLGHLIGYVQADVWCRYQRAIGNECHYVCADDAHGTGIMLEAEARSVSPEELIEQVNSAHQQDFRDFGVAFDNYYTTHSEENRQLSETIYKRLQEQGHIEEQTITQLYDEQQGMFLADRYIKGSCPKCKSPEQYGDNCEACGAVYSARDLVEPYSVLSGELPVAKESKHYFFKLSNFREFLKHWIHSGVMAEEIANKLDEWLEEGLKSWNISRDAPYFGFKIPDTEDKYFYVWLDAPVGYMASFMNYCEKKPIEFDDFWGLGEHSTELYHFLGKDIINFHGLFWPAILRGADFRTPTKICVNGFLMINGVKMSKSRGTFLLARQFLDLGIDPEALRYYFCTKLNPGVEDFDLNLEDFVQRTNSDLVGKVINIASRCSGFIQRLNGGYLSPISEDENLWHKAISEGEKIAEYYEQCDYARAMRSIISIADATNEYVSGKEPWKLAKQEARQAEAIQVCSVAINIFRCLMTYLQPVLPRVSSQAATFLNSPLQWSKPLSPLGEHRLNPFEPLFQRLDQDHVNSLVGVEK